MLNASDPLVKIGITAVVCTVPAIATTAYRLWIRRGRYWADDAWALLSAISQLLMFSGVFIHINKTSARGAMVAAYYLMAAPFYTVVWFARLSILFSIIRIEQSPRRRRNLLIIAIFFFVITFVLVAQLFWVCEPEPHWKHTKNPQCALTRQVVVMQLVTDLTADIILIVAPLRLLRNLSDKKLRRRLTVIFSTCLITTVVSVVHAAFIIIHAEAQEVMAAIVEDCVSLIVCNVPVVVTSLIAMHRSRRRANATQGPSGVQFATWRGRSTANGGSVTPGTTTWMDHFRWDRDVSEDSGQCNIGLPTVRPTFDRKDSTLEVQLSDISVGDAGKGPPEHDVSDAEDSSQTKVTWQDA